MSTMPTQDTIQIAGKEYPRDPDTIYITDERELPGQVRELQQEFGLSKKLKDEIQNTPTMK